MSNETLTPQAQAFIAVLDAANAKAADLEARNKVLAAKCEEVAGYLERDAENSKHDAGLYKDQTDPGYKREMLRARDAGAFASVLRSTMADNESEATA